MTPDLPADSREALIAWLSRQRLALAPNVVALRGHDGQVVVELPRKDGALDELTAGMTDDVD